MTDATSTTATTEQTTKPRMMKAIAANEWGQITDLEPHATYFVMRKPNVDINRERSNKLAEDFKTFLQEQRLVTEKQVQQFNEKYAEPAKARAKELRVTLERRFDEIAKEVESRVGQLETELNDRKDQVLGRKGRSEQPPSSATTSETPGEMPTGESDTAEAQTETSASADTTGAPTTSSSASKKKGGKKNE